MERGSIQFIYLNLSFQKLGADGKEWHFFFRGQAAYQLCQFYYFSSHKSMGGSPCDVSEEPVT